MANDYASAAAWLREGVAHHDGEAGANEIDERADRAEEHRISAAHATLALRAVRAFEALASGRVETLWLYAGEWRVNSRGWQYSATDPLDAITKAMEAPDA